MQEKRPRAALILSFDCEGKWGLADDLGIHARLASTDLEDAYARLCALLERYQIKATFAFVAAFSMSEDEVQSKIGLFKEVGPRAQRWLAPFMADLATRRTDGWLAPNAFSTVKKAGMHELGSHGFSHLPLSENEIDRDEFLRELRSVFKTDAFAKEKDLSLVYPRNQIGFTDELAHCDFVGYRDSIAVPKNELSSQWQHLCNQANPFPKGQKHPTGSGKVVTIPAGRILNWRSGMCERIPISWTARGWRKAMEDALRSGGVAHLWSHPHNFVTGHDMFHLLEEILKIASPLVRSGELWNPTMKDYSLALRNTDAP